MKTKQDVTVGDNELESITQEDDVEMKQPQDTATHLQETPFNPQKMLQQIEDQCRETENRISKMKSSTVVTTKKPLATDEQVKKENPMNQTTTGNSSVAFGKIYKGRPRPKITTSSWAVKLAKQPVWNNRNQVAHKEL